jgi:hypothetical protein
MKKDTVGKLFVTNGDLPTNPTCLGEMLSVPLVLYP